MKVNLMPPALVLFTSKSLKEGQDWIQNGAARGPVVIIRPEKAGDRGLLEHELVHVLLFWAVGLLFAVPLALAGYMDLAPLGFAVKAVLYTICPWWRLEEEALAYAIQSKFYPDDRRAMFARMIATRYDLNVTEAEARQKIGGWG